MFATAADIVTVYMKVGFVQRNKQCVWLVKGLGIMDIEYVNEAYW